MIPQAYLYICDGDIDNPVLTHKKMDWPEKYPHWQEIPLVMAQPEQEPLAWLCRRKTGGSLFAYTEEQLNELGYGNISVPPFDKIAPLYTTPPQRTWVGLTNEEIKKIVGSDRYTDLLLEVVNFVEAKLKEKNT